MNSAMYALCKLGLRLYYPASWATLPYISERGLWKQSGFQFLLWHMLVEQLLSIPQFLYLQNGNKNT